MEVGRGDDKTSERIFFFTLNDGSPRNFQVKTKQPISFLCWRAACMMNKRVKNHSRC